MCPSIVLVRGRGATIGEISEWRCSSFSERARGQPATTLFGRNSRVRWRRRDPGRGRISERTVFSPIKSTTAVTVKGLSARTGVMSRNVTLGGSPVRNLLINPNPNRGIRYLGVR